ncbi:hypothetical protein [Burkholderia multivorans]|uniref:hypothetical protein n=1 Tax=Burkholderia multivorans TaxID=87883 RepID=UPI0011B27A43|nr:hypothetical protein [Burkholderia multivorans]
MEADVVTRFSTQLDRRFTALHSKQPQSEDALAATALGSQDSVLSDYIVARNGRYCLVEFKANEAALRSEVRKELRIALCKIISEQKNPLRWARCAHFVGWGTMTARRLPGLGTIDEESIALASYPGTICPLLRFPVHAPENRVGAEKFIEMFLESKLVGSSAERFEKYLALLFKLAGSCSTDTLKSIEGSVYVYIPGDDLHAPDLYTVRFCGLEHLFQLTYDRKMFPSHRQKQDPEIELDRGIEFGGPSL